MKKLIHCSGRKQGLVLTVILTLLLPGTVAESQTLSGTIVVAVHTRRNVAVAADSRLTGNEHHFTDKGCKIAVLGGNLVFAATGFRGEHRKKVPRRFRFDIYEEARKLVTSLDAGRESGKPGAVKKIADKWADVVAEKFNAAAPWALEDWLALMDNDILADAIFSGLEPNGDAVVAIAVIRYQGPSSSPVAKPEVADHKAEAGGIGHADARGKGKVADEYIHRTTDRARLENIRWNEWSKEDPHNFHARVAARLVELSIQYHPDAKSLGRPTDVVTLTPANGILWVQRKPNCPARTY